MEYFDTDSMGYIETLKAMSSGMALFYIGAIVFFLLLLTIIIYRNVKGLSVNNSPADTAFPLFALLASAILIFNFPTIVEMDLQRSNITTKYDLPEDSKIYQEGAFWKISYIDEDLRKTVTFKVKLDESGEPFDYDTKKSIKEAIDKIDKSKRL